jgi:transcriptional regulator with XRE-family HTH domain
MATDICILLGRRIRRLRKARGWTQIDLAVAMVPEQNQNYISVIERGATDMTVRMAERVAGGLGVDIGELFTNLAAEEIAVKLKPKRPR